ncbi:MAG: long-chain fatty acid transport protein [Moritella sp.]|jgi:long-chain fatty acid transport protein
MSKLKKTTLATALLLVTAQSSAAGFQVSEHSASGLGRAFSGEAAVADNASVLARNPAAMSRFKKAEISIVGSYVAPNVDIIGTQDGSAVGGNNPSRLNNDDIAPGAAIPAAYFILPLNENVAVGLAMFSSYGVTTEYADNYAAGTLGGTTELVTFNINPNISFKVSDQLSLGLGVSAVYGTASLERNYGDLNPPTPGTAVFTLEGDDWGLGWNAGVLFELNDNNRFALAYRSQVDIEFSGSFKGSDSRQQQVDTDSASLDLPLAATAEFSAYHKLSNAFAVSYGVVWTQWSKYEKLAAQSAECTNNLCFEKIEHFDDNLRYAIGAEYTIDSLVLRAGIAYDQAAGETTLNIPETDRRWYTAGASYNVSSNFSVDVGLAYVASDDVEFTETDKAGQTYGFKSEGDAIIASAQANYRF